MRWPTRKTVTVLAMAAMLAPPPVIDAAQRTPIRPVAITDTGGELYLRASLKEQSDTSGGGTKTDEKETFLEEGVELRTRGYAYHPNLLDWSADLRLGLTQEEISINQDDRSSDGNLLGYDLTGLFLREKPVSLYVFGSRSEEFIDRDFARRIELETTREGFEVVTKGDFPMTLLLERTETRELSDRRLDEEETRHLRFSISDQRDRNRQIELTYDREDTDEMITTFAPGGGAPAISDLPVKRDEVNVNTILRFGPEPRQHRLSANLRAVDRRGFYPNRIFSADAALDLNHTETFETFYRINTSKDDTNTDRDRLVTGEAGFTKYIYESLDVTGRAIYYNREFNQGAEKSVSGFLNTLYRKETAIGRYTCSMLIGRTNTETESATGLASVRGEQITLAGFVPVFLSRPNVMPGTIRVMNLARTITYDLNTDYVLATTGARTSVARAVLSSIGNPQDVLVDYSYQTARDATIVTDHFTLTNRLELEEVPLTPYYEYRERDERLASGDDPGNLDTETVHLLGLELDQGGLNVVGEHEVRDQQLYPPSTANRIRVRYTHPVSRTVDMTVGGHVERLVYREAQAFNLEPGRDTLDTNSVYGRLTAKLRRNLLFRAEAEYSNTQGRENREVAEVRLGLEWRYRDIEVAVEVREAAFSQEQNEGTEHSLLFSVRRRF